MLNLLAKFRCDNDLRGNLGKSIAALRQQGRSLIKVWWAIRQPKAKGQKPKWYEKLAVAFLLGTAAQSLMLLPVGGQNFSNFFESGRLRSEDRIIFRAPPPETIPISSSSRSWQYVVFQAGGFSFWMPPGILTEEKVTLDTSLGALTFRALASNGEDRRYVVAYAENLTPAQLRSPQVLLAAIREKVAPANQFQLKRQQEIAIDKYPGQELVLENAKEVITFRAYLAREKVYVLGVHAPKDNPLTRQTRAFFNAFQLLS